VDVAYASEAVVPKLRQVNIAVRDMEAMAAFYERLGLPMAAGQPEWAADHRSARSDDAPTIELDSVEFTSLWNQGWGAGNGIVLAFEVPDRADVDRLHDELVAAGATSQQPPYDAFWGARFAVVADPDGNAVAVTSPVDAAYRSAPPPPPHQR
jgi:catechol 2,3-dioxygenase-like lactoylglutathione lyase family enzyme